MRAAIAEIRPEEIQEFILSVLNLGPFSDALQRQRWDLKKKANLLCKLIHREGTPEGGSYPFIVL